MKMNGSRLRRLTPSLVAIGLLAPAVPAWTAEGDSLQQRVERRLEKKKLDERADIQVATSRERVVLTGIATTVYDRDQAGDLARKEAEEVDNRIEVHPDGEFRDAEIIDAVRDTILRYAYYSIFDDVRFRVQEGHVVLSGSAYQPWRKREIEKRVSKVKGVRELSSEITVQSVSLFDERLRRNLAARIYRDPRLIQYANRAHAPIKIIVNKGKVVLAGYVASPVEQALIGHIARGMLSFGVDNQLRVDGDAPEEKRSTASIG